MSRLTWDDVPRRYSAGVSHAVLFSDGMAVPWNGLIAVDEDSDDSQDLSYYYDGTRVLITELMSDFAGSLQAFTYPDLFESFIFPNPGDSERRFDLSFRTTSNLGDLIHLIYNASIVNRSKSWSTRGDIPAISDFRWDIRASSINVPGARPAAHLVVDTVTAHPSIVSSLEDLLYGTLDEDARMPTPDELVALFEVQTTLLIRQLGNGEWSATGPAGVLDELADGTFSISAPTALFFDPTTFVVDSY